MEQSSSRSISPSRRRLVRSPGANHGAVIGIVGILGFVALAVFGNHPVLAAICAAFLALLDLRLWLAGIRVGPEGVRIVSLLGVSRRAAWETIDHFAAPRLPDTPMSPTSSYETAATSHAWQSRPPNAETRCRAGLRSRAQSMNSTRRLLRGEQAGRDTKASGSAQV